MRKQIKVHQGTNLPKSFEFLLDKLFGKLLFTKNFDSALDHAAQFNLDCVTSEGEIVYAGGFLTKVGFYEVAKDRIVNYQKWKSLFVYLQ